MASPDTRRVVHKHLRPPAAFCFVFTAPAIVPAVETVLVVVDNRLLDRRADWRSDQVDLGAAHCGVCWQS